MRNILTFSGTTAQCGAQYAKHYQREIAGFYTQEFGAYKYSKSYVKACFSVMEEEAPHATALMQGGLKNSLLSKYEHTLLLLHEEELYHRKFLNKPPHCSAAGAIVSARNSNRVVIGQNWDWNTSHHPWTTVNRFAIRGLPRILSLSYPGLPMCAGLNSAGLSLMWTGGGYYPPVCPQVGIPTYALVCEALIRENAPDVLTYLRSVNIAGSFIFIVGDRAGNLVTIEGVQGKIFVQHGRTVHRSNVFEIPEAMIAAKQKLPPEKKCNSIKRNRVFSQSSARFLTRPSLEKIQATLSQANILIEMGSWHATLMQLVADCHKRELHLRAWRQKQNPWITLRP